MFVGIVGLRRVREFMFSCFCLLCSLSFLLFMSFFGDFCNLDILQDGQTDKVKGMTDEPIGSHL